MKLGDAFTMAVPPKFDVPHLYFVISDPAKNNGTYHIVNITKDVIRAGSECVLGPPDHDWITAQSYVNFQDALEIAGETITKIDTLIGKLVVLKKPLPSATLAKIVAAGKVSKSIPQVYIQWL